MRCIGRMLFVGEGPLVFGGVFFSRLIAKSVGVDVVSDGTCLLSPVIFLLNLNFG